MTSLMFDLSWPFEVIVDRDGCESGWIALHGPVVTPRQHEQYAQLRRSGARFVGITSYLDFPRADPHDGLDYESVCEAWCHCFREPDRYFFQQGPRALISTSDFADWTWIERSARSADPLGSYDVVYVGAISAWQRPIKNWALASRCLPMLYHALGLRALVIGHADSVFPPQAGITFCDAVEWQVLLSTIANARLVFVPNAIDPSPRVITEALCLGTPVLMQRHILGGWKYVNRYTGAFFDDECDVVMAATEVLATPMAPREWFRANFGPEHAGRRLNALLRPLDVTMSRNAVLMISAAGPQNHQAE
jgi:glycosyltransferase involved in cell wall biosynthesis